MVKMIGRHGHAAIFFARMRFIMRCCVRCCVRCGVHMPGAPGPNHHAARMYACAASIMRARLALALAGYETLPPLPRARGCTSHPSNACMGVTVPRDACMQPAGRGLCLDMHVVHAVFRTHHHALTCMPAAGLRAACRHADAPRHTPHATRSPAACASACECA